MRTILTWIILSIILCTKGFSQNFVADSVCYYYLQNDKKIRCDLPTVDYQYSHDLWEVIRNGDYININHWMDKPKNDTYVNNAGDTVRAFGSGTGNKFIIQSRDENKVKYLDKEKKVKFSSQTYQGFATDGMKEFELTILWNLYDVNNSVKKQRLQLFWIEPNSRVYRILYCRKK